MFVTPEVVQIDQPNPAYLLALDASLPEQQTDVPGSVAGLRNGLSDQDKIWHYACGIVRPRSVVNVAKDTGVIIGEMSRFC